MSLRPITESWSSREFPKDSSEEKREYRSPPPKIKESKGDPFLLQLRVAEQENQAQAEKAELLFAFFDNHVLIPFLTEAQSSLSFEERIDEYRLYISGEKSFKAILKKHAETHLKASPKHLKQVF